MYKSNPLFWGRIYGKNDYLHPCISRLPQLLVQQFSLKNLTYTQIFTVYFPLFLNQYKVLKNENSLGELSSPNYKS